jgi:hypothetical protein
MAAAPQLTVAPEPIEEPIVLVINGETNVIGVDDPAWRIALHAREEEHARKLAEKDLRGKRALIDQLRRDKEADAERERQDRPDREQVEDIFDRWRTATGKLRCKLTAERFDMTAARLDEEYTYVDLVMAVLGVALNPYVIEGDRKDGYKTALKDGESVERYANRCPAEIRREIRTRFDTQLTCV